MFVTNKTRDTNIVYNSRKFYSSLTEDRRLIDLWGEKPYYGKVDTNFNVIYGADAFLKPISDRGDFFAINFVADAFLGMKEYLTDIVVRGHGDRLPSFATRMAPKSAWRNVNILYHNYTQDLFEMFSKVIRKKKRYDRSIVSFETYMEIFKDFVNRTSTKTPITKSGYILKNFCPHATSGLIIELAAESYSDDSRKMQYFLDGNFINFVNIATQFGFYIDKNAPWRLVANLASPAWQENSFLKTTMETYGNLTLDKILDIYYYKTYQMDIDLLKLHAVHIYNSHIHGNRTVRQPAICNNGRVVTDTISRNYISSEQANIIFDDLFWLKFYLNLRLREMEVETSQVEITSSIDDIERIYNISGYNVALEFVNGIITSKIEQKLKDFAVQREQNSIPFVYKNSLPTVEGEVPVSTSKRMTEFFSY